MRNKGRLASCQHASKVWIIYFNVLDTVTHTVLFFSLFRGVQSNTTIKGGLLLAVASVQSSFVIIRTRIRSCSMNRKGTDSVN